MVRAEIHNCVCVGGGGGLEGATHGVCVCGGGQRHGVRARPPATTEHFAYGDLTASDSRYPRCRPKD